MGAHGLYLTTSQLEVVTVWNQGNERSRRVQACYWNYEIKVWSDGCFVRIIIDRVVGLWSMSGQAFCQMFTRLKAPWSLKWVQSQRFGWDAKRAPLLMFLEAWRILLLMMCISRCGDVLTSFVTCLVHETHGIYLSFAVYIMLRTCLLNCRILQHDRSYDKYTVRWNQNSSPFSRSPNPSGEPRQICRRCAATVPYERNITIQRSDSVLDSKRSRPGKD